MKIPFICRKLHLKRKKTPPTGDKIVEDPDIPPMFTGGSDQMKKFIASTLIYPKEASEKKYRRVGGSHVCGGKRRHIDQF